MLYKYDLVDQVATKWKPKSESRQDTATLIVSLWANSFKAMDLLIPKLCNSV